ncbi:hypothetical protein M948_04020 [Virgibacillus sp. CM-4]|uniref:MFS transporter n=1 Tax=Virgibacillus sp. CM-4 TaxID=1354277 RepID=UPI0003885531|nr:MFS transporter [Virgibacillus sp. CM-4]EQB37733.1 hypothetical protein M948_04020 [Virgibacillus sp. CM-4]
MADVILDTENRQTNVKQIPMKHIFGYSLGALSYYTLFMTTTTYLMYFYTDVVGISAAAAGTIFLFARLVDAISDPVVGTIADRTNTKHGRYRPYILWGTIPLVVTGVLCFTSPGISESGNVIYAAITYILFGMMYSFVNVPHMSMEASITYDPDERSKVISVKLIFQLFGALIASTLTMPLVRMFTNEEIGFLITMVLFGIVCAILLFITFRTTKPYAWYEGLVNKNKKRGSILKRWGVVGKNDKLRFLIMMLFVSSIVQVLVQPVGIYYMTYNVGRADLTSLYMLNMMGATIVGAFLVPFMSKFMEKKAILIFGLSLGAVCNATFFFVPYGSLMLIFITRFLAGIGQGVITVLVFSMIADCVDYGEWKHGFRAQGMTFATSAFFHKSGNAIGGWLIGIVLMFIGYIPNQAQTPFVLDGILWLLSIIPAALLIISIIFVLPFHLTKSDLYRIRADLDNASVRNND